MRKKLGLKRMYSGKVKKKTTHSYDADHYLQCKDIEKKADTLRNNTIFCFFQSFFFRQHVP